MEVREESSAVVLKLFGREPLVEDWRYVGRWSFGAAWLAEDRASARELVRARLAGAAEVATAAAMSAGQGGTERYTLVSALARLHEAISTGQGDFSPTVERAIVETADQLVRDGNDLRAAVLRERSAFAPRFHLEGFDMAMQEIGQDRHVLFREVISQLDDAISLARGTVPSLRALRLFLQSTLSIDSHETTTTFETAAQDHLCDPVPKFGIWLVADLALTARRANPFAAAWAAAARISGDALSKTVAGLTTGAMVSNNVVESLTVDPWSMILALAMTVEPEHAAAILDCGSQAQVDLRLHASKEVSRWTAQALKVDDIEKRAGIAILAPYEYREGYREYSSVSNLDLFTLWDYARTAEEALLSLDSAAERSIAAETGRRRETVRHAQDHLSKLCARNERMVEEAKDEFEANMVRDRAALVMPDGESAQRGCTFGFGAGCSVMAVYMAVTIIMGTAGIIGKMAPIVAAIAALPVAAAILVQVGYALRRSAAASEVAKRRKATTEEYERAKAEAKAKMSAILAQGRQTLEEAEESFTSFERQIAAITK